MDNSIASNPQHYQPLSHALNPPPSSSSSARPRSPYSASYSATDAQHAGDAQNDADADGSGDNSLRHEEEEEEEEEEEVEGAVDPPSAGLAASTNSQSASANANHSNAVPQRRRPGRPKGSKNKKPRFDMSGSPSKAPFSAAPFYGYPPPHPSTVPLQAHPPPHPVPVAPFTTDASGSQYYDFQWRVLSLCSEFYNAADELIRNAPPHVVAQCFSLPGGHVDPISILHEARRACDQLMANPSQAVLKPPAPSNAPPYVPPETPKTNSSPTSAAVITNPGSFVMSLSGPPAPGAYSTFPPPGRYPTTSYYAYATTTQQPGAHPYMAQQQVMKPVNLSTPAAAGNQGAWSEEETDKLRKLAEESRAAGSGTEAGEIDWDWVCAAWGPGRTRHQILIKATNIGMKESSTRGMKRRRETDPGTGLDSAASPPPPTSAGTQSTPASAVPTTTTQAVLDAVGAAAAATASPDRAQSASVSTQPSPVVANANPPPPPPPPSGGVIMHWPMPHVAANTPSPVIASSTQNTRSVYYRDRNVSK